MSGWDGIDEFVAVATAGSFTKAAKAIGMSVTHVSRSIIALEQRVQARLFHRTTRTVRLTDTGQAFFERCWHIIRERDEAMASINEEGEPHGELRVTCSIAMGERFVAPIIRRASMPYPKLNVTIDLTNRIVDLVGEGYDLAIRTGIVTDARLTGKRVASRKLFTCAAPDYLSRTARPMSVDDLQRHDCIVGTSAIWHFNVDGQDVLHRPKGRFRCNSGQAVIEACVAGAGLCQLPDFYILPYLKHGMVSLVLEDIQPEDEPIWAIYPQKQHLLPKVKLVLDAMQHELGSMMNGVSERALV